MPRTSSGKASAAATEASPATAPSPAPVPEPVTPATARHPRKKTRKSAAPSSKRDQGASKVPASSKIFVLDTSVLLYDADAIQNFEEHDIAIPITVLEELDTFKKGNSVTNLNARELIRNLDRISGERLLRDWIPLNGASTGKIRVVTDEANPVDANRVFGSQKNDHRILNNALHLKHAEKGRRVILVSKDINLRLKAKALDLEAEDYETVQVRDIDHLYRGSTEVEVEDSGIIQKIYQHGSIPVAEVFREETPARNHYVQIRNHTASAISVYNHAEGALDLIHKPTAYGIIPRNAEQSFALHAVLNPKIPLVSITGAAGTGKTLLALAGALEQRSLYRQIFLARPIVPLSNKDLGYLPGDVKSKIDPYMQPLWDNLGIIKNQFKETSKAYKKIEEMVMSDKLSIVPLAYIRGRSLSNVIFIVDEAQNLTPHEIKTIITRAGEDTKIIFTGDIFQIDTPYLDTQSNGLSYLVDRMHDSELYAHVNLEKGERSELANVASRRL